MDAVVFITGSPLVNWAFAFPPELVKKNSANRVSKNRRSPMLGPPIASLSWARARGTTASDNVQSNVLIILATFGAAEIELTGVVNVKGGLIRLPSFQIDQSTTHSPHFVP